MRDGTTALRGSAKCFNGPGSVPKKAAVTTRLGKYRDIITSRRTRSLAHGTTRLLMACCLVGASQSIRSPMWIFSDLKSILVIKAIRRVDEVDLHRPELWHSCCSCLIVGRESGRIEEGGITMITTRTANKIFAQMPVARYFSLRVYVLCRMETYTLIRFQYREFVVETQDLAFELGCARAA